MAYKLSCIEPFRLIVTPARTLNDFFAGFFYVGIRARQEVGMVITCKGQGNDDGRVLNRQDFMGKNLLVKEAAEKRGFRGK